MRVPGHQRRSYAWRWTAALAALAVLALAAVVAVVIPANQARADATVTTLASATISADTAGTAPGSGAYTTLTGPVVKEGAAGDISGAAGSTIVLTAPLGFDFDAGAAVTVSVSPSTAAGLKIDDDVGCASPGATAGATEAVDSITIYLCSASTSASTITWSGIKVRPEAGTPLASGNITETGTATWAGVHPANFGVLTEVNGAPATIVLTPPVALSGLVLAVLGPWSAHVEDQFANDAIGAPVGWSITSVPAGATCYELIAPQVTTDGTGDATTSLKLGNLAGNYELSVTSGGAGPTTSVATATGGPGAPCAPVATSTPTPTNTPIVTPTVTGTPPTSTATPTVTGTPPTSTPTHTPTVAPTESVTLVGGTCSPVISTYADGTAITTIANAVSPAGILVSIWEFIPASGEWLGYSPQFPQASDLTAVDRLDVIFICVSSAGSFGRPEI
jgi:hypothetical protein